MPIHTQFTFASHGLRIGIEIFDEAILGDVLERLPPGWEPVKAEGPDRKYRVEDAGPTHPTRFHLYVEHELMRTVSSLDELLDLLEGDIQIYVAEFATPYLFVHAGVVGWHGKAIVLPGSSFAGKSTLVTSLVDAGATYYSDEYAVLDAEGRVHPYPRRVSLRDGPHGPASRLDLRHRSPAAMGVLQPLPVGLVAILRYQTKTAWDIGELSPAQSILALCGHTVPIQRRPADALTILGKVVTSAYVVHGTRGEVAEATVRLLQLALLLDLAILGEDS